MNPAKPQQNQYLHENPADAGKNSPSETAQATISDAPDPQHPPRRKRHGLSMLIVAALLLIGMLFMGIGQAAWPVIDISAVAQLIETVRLATDSLDQVTSAKEALLGQAAILTGVWSDLTGDAYQLAENASSLTTDLSLTGIEASLATIKSNNTNAWPTATEIQNAYAGEDSTVIQQVLDAHQLSSQNRDSMLNAWYDSQIVIAETGEFLSSVETTAGNQNTEVTQGLGAQLDRQIAVASTTRDLAARQLELSLIEQHRETRINDLKTVLQGQLREQGINMKQEMNDSISDYSSTFDAQAFDNTLYTPAISTN